MRALFAEKKATQKDGERKYRAALADGRIFVSRRAVSWKTDPFPVVAAAKFISEAGLRGVSMGGAMISPKHPNFIVNALGADAWDVTVLMLLIKEVVLAEIWHAIGRGGPDCMNGYGIPV